MSRSVQPEWMLALPIQQQSVLLLACRGADGIGKNHRSKDVQRAYRGTVLVAARYGRLLHYGERADTFMSMDVIADDLLWASAVAGWFDSGDSLPHHFRMHLMHGAEILGYKHPDDRLRSRWYVFYIACCADLHLAPESEWMMDARLDDWGEEEWT